MEETGLALAASPDYTGLKWVRTLWGLEPRWTVDPDMAAIMETVKRKLDIKGVSDIEFMGEGAFNKLYIVKAAEQEVVARVTLPIEPKWKTLSEVATIQWVSQNTSLPVPQVLAYDAGRANPIGFEYIIMSKVPGTPWADVWEREVPFSAKEQLVRRIAVFFSEAFAHQMRGIGNLFPHSTQALESNISETNGDDIAKELKIFPTAVESSSQGCCNAREEGKCSHSADVETPSISGFSVQRLVSTDFLANDIRHEVPRGPFASSREWLCARLDVTELDCRRRLRRARKSQEIDGGEKRAKDEKDQAATTTDLDTMHEKKGEPESDEVEESTEDEVEDDDGEDPADLENTLTIIAKLRNHLADFFPPAEEEEQDGAEPEPSVLFHNDMNRHNVLVDDEGALTAVVDWECVSAVPLYVACQYPPFLESKTLEEEPIKSMYQDQEEDGEVPELYWEHRENYELTQLRRVFLAEMRRLQPEWVTVFEASRRQRDFDLAVAACDDEMSIRTILRWLADLESGAETFPGLEERMDDPFL